VKQYSRVLVKVFVWELPLLEIRALTPVSVKGQSTLSGFSTTMCYYISTSPMSLMRGSLNLSLAIRASPWSAFKPPASRLAFLPYLP